MSRIQVGDKHFDLFISEQQIQERVAQLAAEITEEYRDLNPVFLCVLNGAFMFAADLTRRVAINAEISFIKVSSYAGMQSSGEVNIPTGFNFDVANRHVILVEDIIDTGKTLQQLMPVVHNMQPSSVKLAAILSKPEARLHEVDIHFTGFEIPDKFVVGYGLDYNGYGRNMPAIYKLAE